MDPAPGYPEWMCWQEVAKDFGFRGWRKPSKRTQSIGNLFKMAWVAGDAVFQKFVSCCVKRAVRFARLHRQSHTNVCGPQPLWREEAQKINAILTSMGCRIPELEADRWLRSLPSSWNHNL